jgi:caa(3)-type oxidase subunit IV
MKDASLKVAVGFALLLLAAASFGASTFALGALALPVALGIASIKCALVVVVFMEARRERASFKIALVAAVVLLATLLALVVTDVTMRDEPIVSSVTPPPAR